MPHWQSAAWRVWTQGTRNAGSSPASREPPEPAPALQPCVKPVDRWILLSGKTSLYSFTLSIQLAVVRGCTLKGTEEHGLGRSVLHTRQQSSGQTVDAAHAGIGCNCCCVTTDAPEGGAW